ncbi:hypothetical protein B0H34DRAFT_735701 [Crassisporium funariophilum]|nr:hypothetical protein B0H34DRAFT_735701 [Crassisporium funariophilum]
MYTSGSTGAPKGVCLTHGNLVASVGAMHRVFAPHIPPGDTLITYLPLAHVLEYAVELCAIFAGVACGYARPRTLTDSGVRGCKGDLAALKPNVMFGVPGVWEGIRKGIVSEVEKGGWGMETAFGAAMRVKGVGVGKWVPGVDAVLDKFVFGRVKEVLGGNMRFAVNGGAGISMETQEFLNLAVVPLTQGYGLTESCGMCAFLPPEMLSFGPVGIPAPSIEIKLLDCPEMGYFSSTSDNSNSNSHSAGAAAHLPQGEICIRGPSVTEGYFNRPDLNGDEGIFTRDGWFRTGDVGQWNEDGTLSLVDRLKNLVKLPGGEYIALERLEAVYKSSNLISNLCVYVPENATQPIGIIQPHEQNLRHALRSSPSSTSDSGKDGDHSQSPYPELCASPGARQAVLESCNTLAKKNGFGRMEQLGGVVLVDEEWTTGNGMISAAGKVVRGKVGKRWGEGGKEGGK